MRGAFAETCGAEEGCSVSLAAVCLEVNNRDNSRACWGGAVTLHKSLCVKWTLALTADLELPKAVRKKNCICWIRCSIDRVAGSGDPNALKMSKAIAGATLS